MTRRRYAILVAILIMAIFGLMPVFTQLTGSTYLLTTFGRILIFAIGAVSLNLAFGYCGMASFGHAAFIGIGAYAVGILHYHGIDSAYIQWPVALAAGGIFAAIMGSISVRLGGIYFIMITLAFSQMLYFLFTSLTVYGGDDGMAILERSKMAVNLNDSITLYYTIFAVLLLFLLFVWQFQKSRLGLAAIGIASNERRMSALGYPVYRDKLLIFILSGMMCTMSGVLWVNLMDFVSSQYMHWTRSGELMIMVILGGSATLFGPVIGAAALMVLEEILIGFTEHWQMVIGPLLVIIVLFAREGIWGLIIGSRHGNG